MNCKQHHTVSINKEGHSSCATQSSTKFAALTGAKEKVTQLLNLPSIPRGTNRGVWTSASMLCLPKSFCKFSASMMFPILLLQIYKTECTGKKGARLLHVAHRILSPMLLIEEEVGLHSRADEGLLDFWPASHSADGGVIKE